MKKFALILFLATILLLSACGPKMIEDVDWPTDETYHAGTDYQHSWQGGETAHQFAEGESDYYILQDGFVYAMDKKSHDVSLICTKEGCVHEAGACDAYVGAENGIQFHRGWLFYMAKGTTTDESGTEGTTYFLYRMNVDGTERKAMVDIGDKLPESISWVIQRQFFFMAFLEPVDQYLQTSIYYANLYVENPKIGGIFTMECDDTVEVPRLSSLGYLLLFNIGLNGEEVYHTLDLRKGDAYIYDVNDPNDVICAVAGNRLFCHRQTVAGIDLCTTTMMFQDVKILKANAEPVYESFTGDTTNIYEWNDENLLIRDPETKVVVSADLSALDLVDPALAVSPGTGLVFVTSGTDADAPIYYFEKSEFSSGTIAFQTLNLKK